MFRLNSIQGSPLVTRWPVGSSASTRAVRIADTNQTRGGQTA